MSEDHKPSREDEAQRIRDAGGFIINNRLLLLSVTCQNIHTNIAIYTLIVVNTHVNLLVFDS